MKRIVSFVLCLIMVMSVFAVVPLSVSAEETDAAEVGASSGTTGDCKWTLDDNGVLTISGNGKMGNYLDDDIPWGYEITEVIIKDGVTSIGSGAFSYCENLKSITVPNGVKSIGDSAFDDCTSLTSITIPDSVTYIGDHAFQFCTSLTSIIIPNSVTSIGSQAFRYCTTLKSISIPDSVTSIEYCAFDGCTSLTSVTISESVTSVALKAFCGCTSLKSITIPDSVTDIGLGALGYSDFDHVYGINIIKIDDFTIYGYKGSEAEKYAKENGFKFVEVKDEPKPQVKKGDADGDGEITVTDATRIQQYLANLIDKSRIDIEAAKTTGDDLSVIDATRIQQHLAHLIDLEA